VACVVVKLVNNDPHDLRRISLPSIMNTSMSMITKARDELAFFSPGTGSYQGRLNRRYLL